MKFVWKAPHKVGQFNDPKHFRDMDQKEKPKNITLIYHVSPLERKNPSFITTIMVFVLPFLNFLHLPHIFLPLSYWRN